MVVARHFPRPAKDKLTLYVVGPGFGECQVVLLPDKKTMVVDSCSGTAELLRALELETIDLLVVTHPDLDHITGLAALCREFTIGTVWRYPAVGLVRDFAAGTLRRNPGNTRLRELVEAYNELEDLTKRGILSFVASRSRPYESRVGEYRIYPVAPTQFDQARARDSLHRLVDPEEDGGRAREGFEGYVSGTQPRLADRPNMLSIALSLDWKGHRMLLGGDVENGEESSPMSGWKGVLAELRDDDLAHLVENLALVKVAHHGSLRAFHEEAWRCHARGAPPDAVLTPFNRGRTLPDRPTMERLRGLVRRLGMTADPGRRFDDAESVGWTAVGGNHLAGLGCALAVRIWSNGDRTFFCGDGAQFFE